MEGKNDITLVSIFVQFVFVSEKICHIRGQIHVEQNAIDRSGQCGGKIELSEKEGRGLVTR